MAQDLVEHFRKLIQSVEIPNNDVITDEAIAVYESGRDVLLMYRGDSDVLVKALRTFISTQVRPLIYAGAAQVVISASYVSGGKYDAGGISYAKNLYELAANYSLNSLHVALVEVAILGQRKELDKMRFALDSIRDHFAEAKTYFGYILGEMDYWYNSSNIPEFGKWANLGLEHARNNIHRLNILNRLGSIYLTQPKNVGYKQALTYYERVVSIDPEDPWAWHNMSIIHHHDGNYEQAAYCNYRALELMPFGNAFDVLKTLVDRFAKERHKDPIQEVARYDLETRKPSRR